MKLVKLPTIFETSLLSLSSQPLFINVIVAASVQHTRKEKNGQEKKTETKNLHSDSLLYVFNDNRTIASKLGNEEVNWDPVAIKGVVKTVINTCASKVHWKLSLSNSNAY